MSSNPSKQLPKMCKSPKTNFQSQNRLEKISVINEYESLNTNCTVIGSNNLHLVKKQSQPFYTSNHSPGYPQSPYSSPASIKSPSPQLKSPPPSQPNFPVMQIIHNNHQLLARPIQTSQPQNVIKLKPHLNILPKPSASPQPSPKPSVSPQIVIPATQQTTTIMPTAQPLLLNQMPMLAPGVQLILRPQPTKLPTQVHSTAPQGFVLQPSGQPLLQLQGRGGQQMVRVLTNGMQLAGPAQVVTQVPHSVAQVSQHNQHIIHNVQTVSTPQHQTGSIVVSSPKKKPKKKKQKLDLANIMKLSGIGDEDDIQFESDTSQSESEHNISKPETPQPLEQQQVIHSQPSVIQQADMNKRIGNIQISTVTQPTPLVQVFNQSFQSGVNTTSFQTSQAATAAAAQTGIPLNSFITPNITINNGLVVQRNGGFKLAFGEDGRLVLQHDPTLNQDLQSQLLLQSIFGLNGLVLQPSIDQQVHSQTVQTIQQQSVQTIQQQTVQSQTIQTVQQQTVQPQTVQHSLQTIQQTIQPQIQAVQPQTVQQTVQQTIQHQTVQSQPIAAALQHAAQSHQPMQIVQPHNIQQLQQQQAQQQLQSQVQSIQSQIQSLLAASQHSIPLATAIQSQPIYTQPQIQTQQSIVHHNPPTIQSQIQAHVQAQVQKQQQQMQQQQSVFQAQQAANNAHVQQASYSQAQQIVHSQTQQVQSAHSTIHSHPSLQQQQQQQSQPILKVQPFQKSQPPVQTVHPQPVQTIHNPPASQHQSNAENATQSSPPVQPSPTSYVVNLTPDQLEQLKRNGQLTVNGQTIFMQRPNSGNNKFTDASNQTGDNNKVIKLSPKMKPVKKIVTKIQSNNSTVKENTKQVVNVSEKHSKPNLVNALQAPPKILPQVQPHHQVVPLQKSVSQPSAIVQPSVAQNNNGAIHQQQKSGQAVSKTQVSQGSQTAQVANKNNHVINSETNAANPDVEHILGQLLDDSGTIQHQQVQQQQQQAAPATTQRVHTIQLTPQQQQHLKSIQLQIQTLSQRLTPGDTEMHNALKLLFAEQQKILASGKLLPPDKVIYQNNQLTIINPTSLGIGTAAPKSEPLQGSSQPSNYVRNSPCDSSPHQVQQHMPRVPVTTTSGNIDLNLPSHSLMPPPNTTTATGNSRSVVVNTNSTQLKTTTAHASASPQNQQQKFLPAFAKAQLLEQQLTTDQNGAMKPDIHTPFKDKTDACKRLIRYHCYNQPVLSEKDLNKADEIFELTAKHFIDKFAKMVDKYKYLLLKESMRQVQTSELMMLDRMCLAEEQQSLLKLQQELEEAPPTPPTTQAQSTQADNTKSGDDYDEWACIQRELGCIPPSPSGKDEERQQHQQQPPKRTASSDSRLETLKKFRVDKHNKRECASAIQASRESVARAQGMKAPCPNVQVVPAHHDVTNNSEQYYVRNKIVSSNGQQRQSKANSAKGHVFDSIMAQQRMSIANGALDHYHHVYGGGHNSMFASAQQQQLMNHNNGNGSVHSVNSAHHHVIQEQQQLQLLNNNCSGSETDSGNNSIDEQVQSAIDSILNLQQSSNLDLDEAVSSILS